MFREKPHDPHFPYTSTEPSKSRDEDHPYNGAIAFTGAKVARVIRFLEQDRLMDRTKQGNLAEANRQVALGRALEYTHPRTPKPVTH